MKSVLVIDTPNSCVTCPLSFYSEVYSEHECRGREYYRTIPDFEWQRKQMLYNDIRPDWCPLLPLPEPDVPSIEPNPINCAYAQGWNDCLCAITKEKET